MSKSSTFSRRQALKAAGFLAGAGAFTTFNGPWYHNRAFAQGGKPIKLGLTCDASGMYGASGRDELLGIRMAIDEFNANGGVLGRTIEWVTADTETNPATASRVAERFVAREDCSFLLGAIHSGVANAITQIAVKYGTIYMNSNSSSPTESGENCSRVKFVWDGNGTNFTISTVRSTVENVGKRWLLLTNDYVWGHETSDATRNLVEEAGGEIVDNLIIPQGTRDFTSYLIQIQQLAPEVVAPAVGGDDGKILRQQVAELGLDQQATWVQSQQDWPDVWAAPDSIIGVFGTNWYHKLDLPGVPEFVAKWQERDMPGAIPVPSNTSYCGYMATRGLLRAIQETGSTNNVDLIKHIENMRIPAAERMQHFDAYFDPQTHHLQQTIYLARRNANPSDETDLYEIISWSEPKDVVDPQEAPNCKLVPYEDLPVVDA
ncbi:ABC transporter substrate-binding protein [Marinivivus vitaminiproducens]|uniref:ABC transporter substrate-binding protein n=1 Tax=Marinivivus vitaminiproducens TaxID=3035935 RepID=UPI0027A64CFE|nr:ABC transporter substrate-binding protein [Geminicoccaceae bacterium SCSIO 64248]